MLIDGVNAYTYDEENRLTGITNANATYQYDGFNRRVSKTVNGVTTYFISDGDLEIEERDSAGTLLADYVYGDSIDEVLTMSRGGSTYYYHYDGLGSVTDLTDSTGAVVEFYDYDVYGQPSAQSTVGNPFYFTGRRLDPESGIYYFRARMYSPTIGRFLQRDPLTWGPNDPRILMKSKDLGTLFNTIQGVDLKKRFDRNLLKYSAHGSFDPIEGSYLRTDEETVKVIIFFYGQLNPVLLQPYTYTYNSPVNFVDPSGELPPLGLSVGVILVTIGISLVEWALYHLQGKPYDPSRNVVPPKVPGSRSGPNLPRDRRAPTVCPAARGR